MYYFTERMIEADIERVREIERRSFSTLWSAATYRHEIRDNPSARYIVVRASAVPPPPAQPPARRGLLTRLLPWLAPPAPPNPHQIVGYGGVWRSVNEGHITAIAVVPEHRGRGVGELVLNGLIDQAITLDAEILALEVRVSNTNAQQLYLKYGFRPLGTRQRYYTDNSEDALMMWTESIRAPGYQQHLTLLRAALFARLRDAANGTIPVAPLPVASYGATGDGGVRGADGGVRGADGGVRTQHAASLRDRLQ